MACGFSHQTIVGDGRTRHAWTYCLAPDSTTAPTIASGDWRKHRGYRERFLERLVEVHAEGDEQALAQKIVQQTLYMTTENKEPFHHLLPLAKSLDRDQISERKLAQASGQWMAVPR